jgi:hypothetical protein
MLLGQRPAIPPAPLESTQAHPGPYVDDDDDDYDNAYDAAAYAGRDYADDDYQSDEYAADFTTGGYEHDDYDGDDDHQVDDDQDEDDELAEPMSPAKVWLLMVGQVGLGAIAGAGVFLGFSWLWGTLPLVAVLVAPIVIAGLVVIVRRLRRADDLQTTVLAILAGLVVTVSPAALLLLRR